MSKIALVTGSNQGLGFALVKGLCGMLEKGDIIYLCARNKERGEAAVAEIKQSVADLRLRILDVDSEESIASFAEDLKKEHGGVDIVISNAAARIVREKTPAEQVRGFITTNNIGTSLMFRYFLPLLKDNSRFLTVASGFGLLANIDEKLHHLFTEAQEYGDIDKVMLDYAQVVEEDRAAELGWPDWINIPSKIAQVYTARLALAKLVQERPDSGILINSVCPGLVDTDASRPWFDDMSQAKSPDEAAVDVLWLATLPEGTREPQGKLIQYRTALD